MNMNQPNQTQRGAAVPTKKGALGWIIACVIAVALLIAWFVNNNNDAGTQMSGRLGNEADQVGVVTDPAAELEPVTGPTTTETGPINETEQVSAIGMPGSPILIGATNASGAFPAEQALENLDEKVGQPVKVIADVEEVYGSGIFSIKTGELLDNDMLVILLGTAEPPVLAEGMQVVVEGVVQEFGETNAADMIGDAPARNRALADHRDEKIIIVSRNLTN